MSCETAIRPARQTELAAVLDLMVELGRPADDRFDARARSAAAILEREDTFVLVAELEERIVGLACLLILPRLGHAAPEARLLDFVVQPEDRASGLGRTLVEAVARHASGAGCRLLRLECGHQRTEAQGFYRRLGFRSEGREWQLRLA